MQSNVISFLRDHLFTLPALAKFALVLVMLVTIPRLCRRLLFLQQWVIWSLTLPQVAATLAATLVAHETFSADGERLLDDRMLNVVLVLVFTTSILGPLLTEWFASRLAAEQITRPRNLV
jgi:hypothetical protein